MEITKKKKKDLQLIYDMTSIASAPYQHSLLVYTGRINITHHK